MSSGSAARERVFAPGSSGSSDWGGAVQGERPTVADIRLSAIRANFAFAARLAGDREVISVIKADGYGHGAVAVAGALVAAGCSRFAVVTVAEALALRDAGIAVPILVLGGVHETAGADAVIAAGVTPVVQRADQVELLAARAGAAGVRFHAQVEVDTGMQRMGVSGADAAALVAKLAGESRLKLDGVFSHFAQADEPELGPSFEQVRLFRAVLAELRERGIDPGQVHLANSAALMAGAELADALPEATAVRPGLMLYGVRPAPHLPGELQAAMRLHTRVVQVRRVRAGESVGYGATWRAPEDCWIATLPIGYADGIPVASANRGRVLLGGRPAEIVGRVSMDFITVSAASEPSIGDEVELFGSEMPVEEVAARAETLAYSLLVGVGPRVPRVICD
jgi:alanine racemase